jgi:hypothetical protein
MLQKIPNFIQGREPKDTRQIWRCHLEPEVIKTPFTDEEYQKIKHLREIENIEWSEIEKYFKGRY